ncbi:MAG: hypothetical protein J6A58_06790 [Oscillospiraceae bacterium]|nr:hypothetical protein [Oscillospiraceae bacterium]
MKKYLQALFLVAVITLYFCGIQSAIVTVAKCTILAFICAFFDKHTRKGAV